MALFTLKRTDYGANLKDNDISGGFFLKDTDPDPTIAVGTGDILQPASLEVVTKPASVEIRRPL